MRHILFALIVVGPALLLTACGGGESTKKLPTYIQTTPARLETMLSFSAVGLGHNHSCALTTAGEAWCWGANDYGQLGVTTTALCSGSFVPCSAVPLRVPTNLRFTSIGGSERHTCALGLDGKAWCWGFGQGGQLGDGLRRDSLVPVVVAGGHVFSALEVGGGLLTCGLKVDGSAWCWGPGNAGGLGNNSPDGSPVPVQVLTSTLFAQIGAGSNHACGLDAAGRTWCWGRNSYGKLGTGLAEKALVPAASAGAMRFASIAVGGEHTCGVTAAGQAWCWGFTLALGNGGNAHSGEPVAVAGTAAFASLAAGYQHNCGLTADGMAWCWGPGGYCGNGTEEACTVPVATAGNLRYRQLSAGGVHTCGLGLDGLVWCWGHNANGAVGQPGVAP